MSTTVDSRVVEMRFDNKHFESGVSTTMSTLDKLKQKLNFTGGTKGLENVGAAAKKVDMTGLGAGVDAVQAKFSAMQVIGVTALANITNSAVNTGKRMIKALTLDPITTGFQEYETQINAVQTILANTQSKGSTIDDVNVALEELNKYADMTIYNFTEMTRNIGTFTAAGIDLDTSVTAIQGIANLAAVSGSTSQQASTAMYQLSQALASGTVKLMDWNSVVNAGMGGQVFQDALKETSEALGTGAEAAIKAEGSFRESLKTGWLTADVLTATLSKFTSSGANEYVAEYTGLSVEAVESALKAAEAQYGEADAIEHAADALAKKSGKNKDEIKDALQFAKTATDAATKVKTFTQLWDVLKESAQSGWSQTWKLIVGDFEEAKALLTPLADFLTGVINKTSEWRNAIIESALGRGFEHISESMQKVLKPALKVSDTIKDTVKSVADLGDIVNRVIRGEFGNGDFRVQALTEAGINYYEVQNKVNETLGASFRYSDERIKQQNELLGIQNDVTKSTEEQGDATVELSETEKDRLKYLLSLKDAQLAAKGYTKEQIAALNEIRSTAEKLGIPIDEFIDNLDQINGRWLMINSFKNIGQGLITVFRAMGKAWEEIFPETSVENLSTALFNVIAAFHKFTAGLRGSQVTAEKFKRTFKGVFAALDIVLTIVGGPLKIAFKLLTQLLGAFNFNILDITAVIGDALVWVRDFIDGLLDFSAIFEKIVAPIESARSAFKKWVESLKGSENLPRDIAQGIAKGFSTAFTAVKNFIKSIPECIKQIPEFFANMFSNSEALPEWMHYFEVAGRTIIELGKIILEKINNFLSAKGFQTISEDSIAGLVQGFKDGASKVWDAAVQMVSNLVQRVKDFLGIHSPSTVFAAIGGFIIAGLIAGLQNGIPDSLGAIKDVFQPMLDWIKGLDFGAILAAVFGIGVTATTYKGVSGISDMLGGLGEIFAGTGEILVRSAKPISKVIKNTAKVVKSFSKVLNGLAFSIKVDAIANLMKTLGETILMVAAAIFILKFVEPKEMWNAVGAIVVLSAVMIAMAFAMSKLSATSATIDKTGLNIKGLSSGLAGIGIALLLIAATVKMLGSMGPEQMTQGLLALVGIMIILGLLIAVYGSVARLFTTFSADDLGRGMTKLAAAMLIMALVVKILGGMDIATLVQGGIAMVAFAGIMVGLMAATKLISGSKNVDTIGGTLLKIAVALGVMALTVKILAGMKPEEIIQGTLAIVAFSGIIVGLMAATKLITGSKNIDKIGSTLFKIALAIGIMALVATMLGKMEPDAIARGVAGITAFAGIIVGLMAATKLVTGSKNITKIGGTIIAISGAIAIMALTAFMLSMISWEGFAKGTIMITAFAGIIVGLMAATRLVGSKADKISKTLITIAAAIAALALVAVLLSLVPTENLVKGLVAITALSAVMAGLIAVTKLAKNCMGNIIALTVAIAVLAGALYLVSTIPTESLVPSVLALGGLMVVMAVVLALLGVVGKMAKDAMMGVLALATLAVPLVLFGLVLAMMSALKVSDALPNVIALSVLCTVLTALLFPLSLIGALVAASGGMILLGVVALAAMAVPLVLFVGIIALMSGIQNGIANAMALTTMMAILGDVLIKLSSVAPLAVVAVAALSAMINLMTMMGVFATAIGALVTHFPQLQTFLDTGLDILAQLASGLGRVIASFITGFAGEVMTILPPLGLCLSQFMINATPFIVGAKMVDESVLTGVGVLAGAIVALTAADLITGVMSFLSGGSSFADLGTQLSLFMMNAMPFIMGASMLSEDMMSGVKSLAETILILTAADVLQGLTSFITGGSSLESFATQLPILGQGLAAFSTNLGTFSEEQLATVNCAAQAIKSLAQASSEIPNAGGLLGAIVGENDLGTFTDQFPVLGTGLRGFLDNVGTFTDEQVATVNCAAEAIKTLASAASEIPNSGGWVGAIVGENELGTFAEQFPALGTGLAGFISNIGDGFSDDQLATVTCGADAVKTLASAASTIPNEGGWIAKLVGDNSLGTFASNFPKLGEGLAGFVSELGTFSDTQVTTVNAAVRAIKALSDLANADLKGATKHLSDFGDDLPDFADNLTSFCSSMPSTDSTSSAVTNLKKILSAVESIANANSGPLATFAENLKKIGKDAVKNFVEAFTSNSAKKDIKEAAKTLAEKAVEGVRDKHGKMKSAGKYLVEGFGDGITEKTWYAEAKAKAMANAAEKAARKALDINSPSKVFRAIGYSVPEGFAMGIDKMGNLVDNSTTAMAKNAIDNVSSSISRIADVVNTDIDSQPTIRPVLDLSDVRSGTSMLSSMLNMDSSVGVRANVGAISSMMSSRGQNGANDDVVTELAKLRKDIGNLSNTTYQVNGVTYDDGSNIANAVGTLVRAARIERRI